MDEIIRTIIKLNIQLEGAMRVAQQRLTPEVLEAAKEIFERMENTFANLKIEGEPTNENTIVKEEEAVGAEESPLEEPNECEMGSGEIVYDDASAESVAQQESADTEQPSPFSNLEEPAGNQPVPTVSISADDIRKCLTLNDKFLFRRELFDGSDAEFNDTLDLIASMHSMHEVREYLLDDLQWDGNNDTVKDFLTIIEGIFNRS